MSLGSEATVGARVSQHISSKYPTDIITLAGGGIENARHIFDTGCKFDDLNDVSWGPLLKFEMRQRSLTKGRFLLDYDVVHRVTPSGWKNSLLQPLDGQRVVVGPILLSKAPPASFDPIFRPRSLNRTSARISTRRLVGSIARRYLERHDTKLLDRADLIICGSKTTASLLTPQQQKRSLTLPYSGIEHEYFVPGSAVRSDSTLRLLFVGRLVPYKGLELLLRAVAHLRRHVNVKLLIVGSGNRETVGYFRRVATALETTNEVDFVGHVGRAELLGIYQAADLFCMPSIETYGLSILEAMSCGCVPVVADWNGPGEIVESDYGVKVALSDPEQFVIDYAERIVGMMDSPDMRKEMASRARETVVARHSWDKLLMVIGEAYRELLL